jgi:hypothetical protein
MEFKIELSFLNKESKTIEIIAEYPYEAINKALYSLEWKEKNTIKGISIQKFSW